MIIQILAIAFVWIGFFLKLQFPFLTSKRPIIIYLKQKAYYFIIFSWIIAIFDYLINYKTDYNFFAFYNIILSTMVLIIIRHLILYDKIYPKLMKIDLVNVKIHNLIKEEPEVAVLSFNNKKSHIYPIALLRVGDIVYNSKDKLFPNYSLTNCLLCNTIHAYKLPEINGKIVEITSNNGSVLNGNKILADKSGRYVWQQFTGKGLNSRTQNHSLQEIPVKRYVWEHAIALYPNSYIYYGSRKFLSKIFFNLLAYFVKNFSKFSFSLEKTDPRLKRKDLVIGIEMNGLSKAYPIYIFDPFKLSMIEDRIGNQNITLIFNNGSINVFLESNLIFKDGKLWKNDMQWSLNGISLSNDQDLKEILVTEKAYWYMWSKFHPKTDIFTNI